jgi:molybdopterin-guanine dinucleotide biosynthesis protein A
MGRNKALLRPVPGGMSLIEMVVARLAEAGLTKPVLISNDPGEYSFLNLEIIPDDIPGTGALGGVLTALRHSTYDLILVVACDMPFLNPTLLRYMCALPGKYDVLVPAWNDSDGVQRVEPLHAIYAQSAIPLIEQRISSGKLKMGDLLGSLAATYLSEQEIRSRDPGLLSFRNINTPGEYERLLI